MTPLLTVDNTTVTILSWYYGISYLVASNHKLLRHFPVKNGLSGHNKQWRSLNICISNVNPWLFSLFFKYVPHTIFISSILWFFFVKILYLTIMIFIFKIVNLMSHPWLCLYLHMQWFYILSYHDEIHILWLHMSYKSNFFTLNTG